MPAQRMFYLAHRVVAVTCLSPWYFSFSSFLSEEDFYLHQFRKIGYFFLHFRWLFLEWIYPLFCCSCVAKFWEEGTSKCFFSFLLLSRKLLKSYWNSKFNINWKKVTIKLTWKSVLYTTFNKWNKILVINTSIEMRFYLLNWCSWRKMKQEDGETGTVLKAL